MQLAFRVGATDKPDQRKIHKKIMPRMGGLAIFISFSISLILLFFEYPPFHVLITQNPIFFFLVCISFLTVFLLGIWDDIHALKPGLKFLVQWFAATLLYLAGFQLNNAIIPIDLGAFQFLLNYPLTIIWIIGITNAFNLIDGLDGLAAGIATIAAITISIISVIKGDYLSSIIMLLFMGSILGFLKYNFHPAKIFLGDSGSLFIGLLLALFSIEHFSKSTTVYSLFIPILALGLPVLDTLVSMFRRFIKSYLPESLQKKKAPTLRETLHNIFLPDKSHIHHQLLTRGFSHKGTVMVMYLVSLVYGTGAILIAYFQSRQISLVISFFLLTFTLIGIHKLKYREVSILRNGFFIPLLEELLIKHRIINHLLDILFVWISFVGAYILVNGSGDFPLYHFQSEMVIICLIQIVFLSTMGLYKESIKQFGIGDILQLLRKISIAVFASLMVTITFNLNTSQYGILSFWLLDFYFMITLVIGLRIAHPVLNYLFERYRTGQKKRVLIYGADKKGILALHNMLTSLSNQVTPIGFMDDNPELEGHLADGYPIFGGHWKLPRLLKTYNINQILITTETIKPIVFERIELIAKRHGASVQLFHVYTEEVSSTSDGYQSFSVTNHSLYG